MSFNRSLLTSINNKFAEFQYINGNNNIDIYLPVDCF